MKLSDVMRAQIWPAPDWVARARALEDEIERVHNRSRRSTLLYELGRLYEYISPDRELALWPYGRSWKATGSNTPALGRARAVYLELGQLHRVGQLAFVEFKQTSQPDYLAIAGEAYLDAGETKLAIKMLRAALEFRPHDIVLKDALEVATIDPSTIEAEVTRLSSEARSGSPITRTRLCLRIARMLWPRRDDDPRCQDMLRLAHSVDPEEDRVSTLLELMFVDRKRWDELAEMYKRRASATSASEDRIDLLRRGGMLLTRSGQPALGMPLIARAIRAIEEADEEDVTGHLAMYSMLRDVCTDTGMTEQLLSAVDAALRGARTEDEILSMALFAGDTAWRFMKDPTRARQYFRLADQLCPDHPSVADYLNREQGPPPPTPPRVPRQKPARPRAKPTPTAAKKPAAKLVLPPPGTRPVWDNRSETQPEAQVSPFSVPIEFRGIDADLFSDGRIRDFSKLGVFVMTEEYLEEDDWVIIRLMKPGPDGWETTEDEWEALVTETELGIGFSAMLLDSDVEFRAAIGALRKVTSS